MRHHGHQDQHRGGHVQLQLRHGEHDEHQPQRRRHEQPEHVAPGVDDVAHVPAHRSLVARQQVGLFAGHHALAAVGHPRRGARPCSALRSSRLSLGPASDLRRARASAEVIGAGATGPAPRLSRALGRRPALGGGRSATRGGSVRADGDAASSAPSLSSGSSSLPFLRPSSFTSARLLRAGGPGCETAGAAVRGRRRSCMTGCVG